MRNRLFLASTLLLASGLLITPACDEGSGSSGNTGGAYQGPCAQYDGDCVACVDAYEHSCEWCGGKCVVTPPNDGSVAPGASCEWGWADDSFDCTDHGGIRLEPTSLDIDCRAVANHEEPRCQNADLSTPGSIGAGPAFPLDGGRLYGGFIDAARIVVGAITVSPEPNGSIWSVDLATGDRTLVSGTVFDPLQGELSRGSGPALGTHVVDVEPISSSAWIAWTFDNSVARVLRVDAASGDRTLVYEDDPRATEAPCANGAFRYRLAGFNSSGLFSIVAGTDGSIYVPLGNGTGASTGDVGIGVLSPGGLCSVVTLGSVDAARRKGAGPAAEELYRGLTTDGTTLYAVAASSQLHAVDVSNGDRTLRSEEGILGEGPAMKLELLAFSGGQVWSSGGGSGGVRIDIDPATGTRTMRDHIGGPLSGGGSPLLVLPHPTASGVAVATLQSSIVLYEPSSGNNVLLSR